ncbi:hypothetical protein [Ralstonia pseudosolanacearum]
MAETVSGLLRAAFSGVTKNNADRLAKRNASLKTLQADGTVKAFYLRWGLD